MKWNYLGTETELSPYIGVELEANHLSKSNRPLKWSEDRSDTKPYEVLQPIVKPICEQYQTLIQPSTLHADGGGVEIDMNPATYEFMNEHPKALGFLAKLRMAGLRGDQTGCAGMHIHVRRAAFSQLHHYNMWVFLVTMREFIKVFCCRKTNSVGYKPIYVIGNLVAWSKQHINNIYSKGDYSSPQGRWGDDNNNEQPGCGVRYNGEHGTIEYRFFNATLSRKKYMANVGFIRCMFEFTKLIPAHNQTMQNFFIYVADNKDRFPDLYKVTFTDRYKKFRKGL